MGKLIQQVDNIGCYNDVIYFIYKTKQEKKTIVHKVEMIVFVEC